MWSFSYWCPVWFCFVVVIFIFLSEDVVNAEKHIYNELQHVGNGKYDSIVLWSHYAWHAGIDQNQMFFMNCNITYYITSLVRQYNRTFSHILIHLHCYLRCKNSNTKMLANLVNILSSSDLRSTQKGTMFVIKEVQMYTVGCLKLDIFSILKKKLLHHESKNWKRSYTSLFVFNMSTLELIIHTLKTWDTKQKMCKVLGCVILHVL